MNIQLLHYFSRSIENIHFQTPLTEPNSSATAPTANANDVVSLFSDSYTNNHSVSTWRTNWSAAGLVHATHTNTTGDTSQKYTFNGNSFGGIDLASPYLDASNTVTIHQYAL